MKKLLALVIVVVCTAFMAQAELNFSSNMKYRIECKQFSRGSMVLGEYHNSTAEIYYDPNSTNANDGWWFIEKASQGYTIRNAYTSQYLNYTTKRAESSCKGLTISYIADGTKGEWTFKEMDDGYVAIVNVAEPTKWFNVRNNTNLVGTYDGNGGNNELFIIYDQYGNKVSSSGSVSSSPLTSYLDYIGIGTKELVLDNSTGTYFATLPESAQYGANYTNTFNFTLKSAYSSCTMKINGEQVTNGGSFTINNISCESPYDIEIVTPSGNVMAASKLQFTYLPLVEMTYDYCNGDYYNSGTMRVTWADRAEPDSVYIAAFKYRGATAQNYEKKSYGVKFRDENDNSVDRSFFGLRSDNNWILDAMVVDHACMRNRVATDVWNAATVGPYYKAKEPKAITGTRGKFVEVFLNGAYHGLYCMTEKIDRKQLKLKKYKSAAESTTGSEEIRGLLYKTDSWSYEVFMGHKSDVYQFPGTEPSMYKNSLGVENWCGYEFKYPDFEEEAVDWAPIYDAVSFVATSDQRTFDSKLATYFDRPVLDEYYLFIELLLATDNHGKNMHFFVYDKTGADGGKISICPWDLDGTWGGRWDGSTNITSDAYQDFDSFIWQYEHGQNTLYHKMKESTTLKWEEALAARYEELRNGAFNRDAILKRFTDYATSFEKSYADVREQGRWPSYHKDILGNVDYIKDWVNDRLDALDEKYGFDEASGVIDAKKAEQYFTAMGSNESIIINTATPCEVSIYTVDGMMHSTVDLQEGVTEISDLAPAIYIVSREGHSPIKVVVK